MKTKYLDFLKLNEKNNNLITISEIEKVFTGAFRQIPQSWVGEILPAGATFQSVYQDFSN